MTFKPLSAIQFKLRLRTMVTLVRISSVSLSLFLSMIYITSREVANHPVASPDSGSVTHSSIPHDSL